MKSVRKKSFNNWYNKLLTNLLTLLGFGSPLALVACYAPPADELGYLDISEEKLTFPAEGGVKSAVIVTEKEWRAYSNDYFISVSPSVGDGPDLLYVTAQPNYYSSVMKGTVNIQGIDESKFIQVEQEGFHNILSVTPDSITFTCEKGQSERLYINTLGSWYLKNNLLCFNFTSTYGFGMSTVTVSTLKENTDSVDWSDYIYIEGVGDVSPVVIPIVQKHK